MALVRKKSARPPLIKDHNIYNAIARLKRSGDLFNGVLGKGINLQRTLKKIQSTFQRKLKYTFDFAKARDL